MFVARLERTVERYGLVLHAFALMGNHYHLLLETPMPCLSKAIHYLNSAYATAFNRRHNRVGHVLQGRFKSIVVGDDDYLLNLADYIHLNPVRAGMVGRPHEYCWTSYNYYVGTQKTHSFVERDRILALVGGPPELRPCLYRERVLNAMGNETSFLENLRHGCILGTDAFVDRMRKLVHGARPTESVPQRRRLEEEGSVDRASRVVAAVFGVDRDSLLTLRRGRGCKNVARDVAVYLLGRYGGLSNREIGRNFGISSSAVGLAVKRTETRISLDRTFSGRMRAVDKNFNLGI